VASIVRTVVFAKTLAAAGPLDDSTCTPLSSTTQAAQLTLELGNHVALINWTIIEPGLYLLSACALSFKPLFRMLAKALHLQAFLTHTKTTYQPGKSQTTRNTNVGTQNDVHLQSLSGIGSGKFYRLSEDSQDSKGSKKIEVLVTKTVDVDAESQYPRRSVEVREYAKHVEQAI
jgi:hypothetical protein